MREVLEAPEPPEIEVTSARPEWVELVVPCTREAAEQIQTVMSHLDTDLPAELRESIGYAFRELLLNAVEWGGRLDPTRKVRIAYLRAKRMMMYRIADPGQGFNIDELPHAADRAAAGRSDRAHAGSRREGTPTGRIRVAQRSRERGRVALQRKAERSRVREVSGIFELTLEKLRRPANVFLNLPVADRDDPVRIGGNVRLVCDEHDGVPT